MGQEYDTRRVDTAGWDRYWEGASGNAAYADGGANHPGIRAFWVNSLSRVRESGKRGSMLDIASGAGAVVETAFEVFDPRPRVTCVDTSAAAIAHIESRFAGVQGLVCDARDIPLDPGSFDIVTSQFGIEYAGLEAFSEAARLLSGGGMIACLVHHRNGVIQQECVHNLEATRHMQATGFIPLASRMLRAGFAAVRGADRQPYDEAALALAPAARAVEDLVQRFDGCESGDTIARIYADVARFHEKMPTYDPDEVLDWLSRSGVELEAYAARMESMVEAALDEAAFTRVCRLLTDHGCVIGQSGPFLVPEYGTPLAWAVVATKP